MKASGRRSRRVSRDLASQPRPPPVNRWIWRPSYTTTRCIQAATNTNLSAWGRDGYLAFALSQRRRTTVGLTHLEARVAGRPDRERPEAGTLWSAAHSYADALRMVSAAIMLHISIAAADGLDDDRSRLDDSYGENTPAVGRQPIAVAS